MFSFLNVIENSNKYIYFRIIQNNPDKSYLMISEEDTCRPLAHLDLDRSSIEYWKDQINYDQTWNILCKTIILAAPTPALSCNYVHDSLVYSSKGGVKGSSKVTKRNTLVWKY